jgi:hypothetical protein
MKIKQVRAWHIAGEVERNKLETAGEIFYE